MESYYAGAYWGQRQETIEACTDRAHRFLSCLAECHLTFREWRVVGRKQRLSAPFEREPLTKLLLAGRNRDDADNRVTEELGFSLSLWSSLGQGKAVGLSLHCGDYSSVVVNHCVLNLFSHIEIYSTSALIAIATCLVVEWKPEKAFLISREYSDRLLDQYGEDAAKVGWITYVCAAPERLRALLPPTVQIHPLDANASLVVITDETFTVDNPSHVATADAVRFILIEQGLL